MQPVVLTVRLLGRYAATNDKLALLWDKHFCRNTVHVDDVCLALWLIAQKAPAGELYNLADPNNTST